MMQKASCVQDLETGTVIAKKMQWGWEKAIMEVPEKAKVSKVHLGYMEMLMAAMSCS